MSTYMTQHCCRVNKESCHTPYFRVKLARRFLIFGADSFRLAIFFSVPIVMRLFFIPYKTINRTKTSNPKLKRHKLRKKKPYRETRARSKGSAFPIVIECKMLMWKFTGDLACRNQFAKSFNSDLEVPVHYIAEMACLVCLAACS
jgi:hypothetical protein